MLRLTKNKNLEIKSADRGGAVVVMNRKDYEQECLRQLQNEDHDACMGTDQTEVVAERVTNYLRLCKKQRTLPEKIADYLIPKDSRTKPHSQSSWPTHQQCQRVSDRKNLSIRGLPSTAPSSICPLIYQRHKPFPRDTT